MSLDEKIVWALKSSSIAMGTYFCCKMCGKEHEAASTDWWLCGPYPEGEEEPTMVDVLCGGCLEKYKKSHQDVKRFWNTRGCIVWEQFWGRTEH